MSYTLGSLFDGSGGFPLAGSMCGIEPIFASEIEPYPIAVTTSRFPKMKHLGDVSKINGAEVEPVDVITFGSPCQDLSVAGKRAGLKHEDNGDEETTRSGLFMEAIRIIKEMRKATNGIYPRIAVWENVPGAYSSNKGEDFRMVLEEIVKIVEPTAEMPPMPKGGWAYADVIVGDGWSIAYRTYDLQYWGVPQRRRRIYLVADFRGECAGEISFKREGLRGYFTEGRTPWQRASADAQDSIEANDSKGTSYGFPLGFRPENVRMYEETATTLCNGTRAGFCNGVVIGVDSYNHTTTGEKAMRLRSARSDAEHIPCVVYDARGNGDGKTVSTLTGDHENRVTDYTSVICIQDSTENKKQNGRGWCEDKSYILNTIDRPAVVLDRAFYNQGENALYDPQYYTDGTVPTLVAKGPSAVCYEEEPQYIVRRLTPTECARLQGFPDKWGHPDKKEDLTDEEYKFWFEVRKTDAEINGKQIKEWTKPQILTWYNKLHTDSAEYKMWGNGIGLPNALYVMQGIAEVLKGNE